MMLRQLPLQALALLTSATVASAGVLIVGTYTGTKTPDGRTVEFRIQDGRGKITSDPTQAIYYDHAKRTAYIVDTTKKTSFEMNEARAKQMGAQLGEAQKMMEAKLKEMPADKRAMVEEMLKKQGGLPPAGSGPRKPLVFAKTGSGKVGEWSCDRYAASGDGRNVEVCTAEAATLGIAAEDMAVFEGFLELSEKMAGEAGQSGGIGSGPDRGFPGMPLERSESRGGEVTDRFTIETVEAKTIAATELQVPSGLKAVQPQGGPPPR
jgi:hypothetical protein